MNTKIFDFNYLSRTTQNIYEKTVNIYLFMQEKNLEIVGPKKKGHQFSKSILSSVKPEFPQQNI